MWQHLSGKHPAPAYSIKSTVVSSPRIAIAAALLLLATGAHGGPSNALPLDSETSSATNPFVDYFQDWFSRVSAIQAAQPHWVTPLVTVTPRLEEELRYDQFWESLTGGHTLINYGGGGGKGVELIPFDPVEVIIGIPSWQTVNTEPPKKGWTDESFLIKYRLLAANEENGDYIVTAFMGLTVPNGSNPISTHHFAYSPTIAFGKGFGDFDVQRYSGRFRSRKWRFASWSGDPDFVQYCIPVSRAKVFMARGRNQLHLLAEWRTQGFKPAFHHARFGNWANTDCRPSWTNGWRRLSGRGYQ